jgi:hypothetical protein
MTGALTGNGAAFAKTQVRIEGSSKVFARDGQAGRMVRFHFCPNCGHRCIGTQTFDRTCISLRSGHSLIPTFPHLRFLYTKNRSTRGCGFLMVWNIHREPICPTGEWDCGLLRLLDRVAAEGCRTAVASRIIRYSVNWRRARRLAGAGWHQRPHYISADVPDGLTARSIPAQC